MLKLESSFCLDILALTGYNAKAKIGDKDWKEREKNA